MKIAVSASGPSLDHRVEARFGRCPYFLVVDTDTLQVEAVANPNITLGGGAGTQSAALMADKGVTVVLTGNCGPNAFEVFGAAGIRVVTGVEGVVRDAVEGFKAGALKPAPQANAPGQVGMGGGRGMGRGRGMGCGGGMGGGGRGRTMGFPSAPEALPEGSTGSMSQASEAVPGGTDVETLRKTADELRRQLEALEERIQALAD